MSALSDETSGWILTATATILHRADTANSSPAASGSGSSAAARPPNDKVIGIALAIASGLFIGTSFVLKKKGLLGANEKYHEEAGEGYGYLKNAFWWIGMTLMIVGEICNFVAYAFTDAIIVTPMGALSVVICAILSAIFLKERLSFVGKMACVLCILGSIIIPLNAPGHAAVKNIQDMQRYVIAPGFLSYAGVIILGSLFTIFWVGPRYGKKSMFVYISICSWIGGLSVVATQGLGSAVIAQARGEQQFNQWFLYVLFVFVVATLLTEIVYLNKALNIFNAAMVTPTYYVYFTSTTIVTSAVLFQGFGGTPVQIITIVLGFLTICSGVVLLQMSNSAKDVPDTAIFSGDLDQMRTIAEQEQPESEPKADTFRGAAGILRTLSKSRRKMEHDEAKRIAEDRRLDQLETIGEGEAIEWDGLRRRKTVLGPGHQHSLRRQHTQHPPLGMSHFPEIEDDDTTRPTSSSAGGAFGFGFRRKSRQGKLMSHAPAEEISLSPRPLSPEPTDGRPVQPVGIEHMEHIYGLPAGLKRVEQHDGPSESSRKPLQWAIEANSDEPASPLDNPNLGPPSSATGRRTFSFQNVFQRVNNLADTRPASRHSSRSFTSPRMKDATEEERLGLVKGDSHLEMPERGDVSDENDSIVSELEQIRPVEARYDESETWHTERPGLSITSPTRSHYVGQPGRRPLPLTPETDENEVTGFHTTYEQQPR